MNPLRLHVPALPGQPTVRANCSCAYTQKVRRFATMMRERGHEVFLYGGGGNDARASEYVPAYRDAEPLPFDPGAWGRCNAAVIGEIAARIEAGDFLCLIAGRCQEIVARAFPAHRAVEFGVGYSGVFADFRVFESHVWATAVSTWQTGGDPHGHDGRAFDTVIPNYFDVEDFPEGKGGGGLLYVGRLVERKGVEVAVNVARITGQSLVLAGEGDYRPGEGEEGITYVGHVDPERRAGLMGEARCLLAPTTYVEPFGGVAVEAQLCGTPAVTTDWGAFTETVVQGLTGWRCRRLGEFVWAAEHAHELPRGYIRERAAAAYSTERAAERYETYFEHLRALDRRGWYDPTPSKPPL